MAFRFTKIAAPSASFGQGAGRFPITSPLRDIYRDWERRFVERLVAGWQRKFMMLIPALRQRYPDKAKFISKAQEDLLGLPPEFWQMWEEGYIEDILPFMEEAAVIAANLAIGDLESQFSVSVEPGRVNAAVADWAFENTMNLVRETSPRFRQTITETDRDNLRSAIAGWAEVGGTFPDLVTRIQESTWMSNYRATMIAATEATRAYSEGAQAAWRESGMIDAKRWNTARDEIVCPVCRPLDGVRAKLDEMFFTDLGEVDGPPAHVNCRCYPSPVIQDPNAILDAMSQDGAVGDMAENLLTQAGNMEPAVTQMLQDLARANGGQMQGTQWMFKDKLSLMRKLNLYMDEGLSLEEAAGNVNDALRYTMQFDRDVFSGNVLEIQRLLEAQGWQLYDTKAKNYFGYGDAYDGYNTVMVNVATGQRFELQYHTPDSYRIKQAIHPLYEEFRILHAGSTRAVELWNQMVSMWGTYEKPLDWQMLPGLRVEAQQLVNFIRQVSGLDPMAAVMGAAIDPYGIDASIVGGVDEAIAMVQRRFPNLTTQVNELTWKIVNPTNLPRDAEWTGSFSSSQIGDNIFNIINLNATAIDSLALTHAEVRRYVIQTFLHEYGHYLDYNEFGALVQSSLSTTQGGGIMSNLAPIFMRWQDAVESTDGYSTLEQALSGGSHLASPQYAVYALQPHELWARAFAQYILDGENTQVLNPLTGQFDPASQWQLDDFLEVRKVMSELFQTLGWEDVLTQP